MFLLQNWQRYNASKYFTGIFGALCRPIYAFFQWSLPEASPKRSFMEDDSERRTKVAKIWGLSVKL